MAKVSRKKKALKRHARSCGMTLTEYLVLRRKPYFNWTKFNRNLLRAMRKPENLVYVAHVIQPLPLFGKPAPLRGQRNPDPVIDDSWPTSQN